MANTFLGLGLGLAFTFLELKRPKIRPKYMGWIGPTTAWPKTDWSLVQIFYFSSESLVFLSIS